MGRDQGLINAAPRANVLYYRRAFPQKIIDRYWLRSVLLCYSFLLFQNATAVQETPVFGEIEVEDLRMKFYAADTSADAVILYDRGDLRVEPTFVNGTTLKRHLRIKILKKGGTAQGTVYIPVVGGDFSKLKGATYTLENDVVVKKDLTASSVFRTRVNQYIERISIAFPDAKVGSVVECSYVIASQGLYLPRWKFQYDIPVRRSEYSMLTPAWQLSYFLQGYLSFTREETTKKNTVHFWQMCNVPAFKEEPLMPDASIFQSSLLFAKPQNNWAAIHRQLMKDPHLMGIINGNKSLNAKVKEIVQGIDNPAGKARAVSVWIKENIRWDGIEDFRSDEPADILKAKTGSAGDINIMLVTMLRKAGLDAVPVLLSTRDNGFVLDKVPSELQFNYLVCRVTIDDKDILLDATERDLPYHLLPPRCFNHKGFVISEKFYGWIPVEPTTPAKTSFQATLVVKEDGKMTGTLAISRAGYAAFAARKILTKSGATGYLEQVSGTKEMKSLSLKNGEVSNNSDTGMPVLENYNVNLDGRVTNSGDRLYVDPFVFLQDEINPFQLQERNYPIDFDELVDKTMVCSIRIPAGYEPEQIPANKILALKDDAARCAFSTTVSGDDIHVVASLKINKTLFEPDEYPSLREFYTRFLSKVGESIVLKRTKN